MAAASQSLLLLGTWTAQQVAEEPEVWKATNIKDRPYLCRSACGRSHALFVSGDEHNVYAAGTNDSGQVVFIFVLLSVGGVSWHHDVPRWCTCAQLGLQNTVTQFKLQLIPLFTQLEARAVACGSAHSAVLAMTGHIFTFGWYDIVWCNAPSGERGADIQMSTVPCVSGSYGRLGIGTKRNSSKPRRVRVYAPGDEGFVLRARVCLCACMF